MQVYKSNWMPRPSKPILTPTMRIDSAVVELINDEQHQKEALIHDRFRLEDAKVITQIPLLKRPKEDKLIWHYDKRGQYSVKSGYQVAMKKKFPYYPSWSTQNPNQWSFI